MANYSRDKVEKNSKANTLAKFGAAGLFLAGGAFLGKKVNNMSNKVNNISNTQKLDGEIAKLRDEKRELQKGILSSWKNKERIEKIDAEINEKEKQRRRKG